MICETPKNRVNQMNLLGFINKINNKMQENDVEVAKKYKISKKNLVFHTEMLYNIKG